ncbi:unnamed protein product [Blepharisma stoltei]|uniref:Zinc finger LSD1-type domain-containing protein n=1 Tax=Blepharisma stoltei TaxID=1481888 RepID=A0AAU9JK86_9CILI|nr:unnamed protein product [Blepharisma stoltei]
MESANDKEFMVVLPDGELALATEVKTPQRSHLICYNCKTHLVYESFAETVRCGVCNSLNGTQYYAPHSMNYIVCRCGICHTMLRAPANCVAVCCPNCRSISIIGR